MIQSFQFHEKEIIVGLLLQVEAQYLLRWRRT